MRYSSDAVTAPPLSDVDAPPPPRGRALVNAVEALLFAADHPVSLVELQRALGVAREDLEPALAELVTSLGERGVRLQRHGDEVQMVTAPETARFVERFFGLGGTNRLSQAALETLAIIAYHQPVTRAQIEAIRGVNADYAVNVLVARGLVQETGRLATAGRPALFGTTMEFLQYLGIASLDELPHPQIRHPAQTDMFAALDRDSTPADSPVTAHHAE